MSKKGTGKLILGAGLGAAFLVFLVFILVIVALSCIRIVPQAYAYVVESLGTYKCTWSAGLHFKTPIIDKVARRVTLKEQVVDFAPNDDTHPAFGEALRKAADAGVEVAAFNCRVTPGSLEILDRVPVVL